MTGEMDLHLVAQLPSWVRSCACGFRAESPITHPHVSGCPVAALGEAIPALIGCVAEMDKENARLKVRDRALTLAIAVAQEMLDRKGEARPVEAMDMTEFPTPEVGAVRKCLLCAHDKAWAVFSATSNETVCVECRDAVAHAAAHERENELHEQKDKRIAELVARVAALEDFVRRYVKTWEGAHSDKTPIAGCLVCEGMALLAKA